MNVLPFQIYLEQPLLMARPSGDANSLLSLDYIPGSLLRGVLIGRYLRRPGVKPDLAADPQARRLFFDGGVRILHAYLLGSTQQRSLPMPLALLQGKSANTEDSYTAYNAAHAEWNAAARREAEQDDVLKPLGQPYCTLSDQELAAYRAAPGRIAVHVQRDRGLGRATENSGAIFQYEALAADQWFEGALLIDDAADVPLIQALLQTEKAWIGRSRSASYGQVKLSAGQPRTTPWREVGDPELEDVAARQPLSITLLSDVLLRDAAGQPVGTLARQTALPDGLIADTILSAYLGFAVQIDPARSFSAATTVGGFNQTWRLPLPQQPALKAGSHFILHALAPVSAEQLGRLEERGIGERRAEGFGRIAFQWLTDETYSVRNEASFREQELPPELSIAGTLAAQRLARRLLEQQIDQALSKRARDLSAAAHSLPHNSQLGRVRALVREASQHGDLNVISDGIEQVKAAGRSQLERAKLDNRSLLQWLAAVTQPEASLAHLNSVALTTCSGSQL